MSAGAIAVRQIAVALQLAATSGTAAALWRWLGWPLPLAASIAILAYVFLFALSVGLAFLITLHGLGVPPAARPRLPAHLPLPAPLSTAAAGRCWWRECVAVWRMFNFVQPFRSGRAWPSAAAPHAALPPLLLIHGYGCNHAVWQDLQPKLAHAGYRCEWLDLHPLLGDIDDYGRQIADHAARVHARYGQAPILLCHSMGGLAGRAALRVGRHADGGTRIAHLVTLGTPHQGTALARHGQGCNARQMRCGSHWLAQLAREETPDERARITSIFSWHDSIVGPPGTGWLDGAQHLPLSGLGHVSLLTENLAHETVLSALARLHAPQHVM
ncbi:esterase/lipase family protein [Imbroritus primus]|uniref:esterase/lipase family protein n=1 Tax=Imbroritus primus TaxID=3058603 RepID=UPI003D16212B